MKILGYDYTVDRSLDGDMIGANGRLLVDRLVIQIASEPVEQARMATTLHEIIEALNWHMGLGMEHHVIEALEVGLFQVFQDNDVDLSPLLEA